MTLVAVASLHGAPGATTVATGLAASWPTAPARPVLVVEADPHGGVLAARFEGLRADRTTADVAVAVRRGFSLDAVLAAARPLWDTVPVVVSPPSAEQSAAALAAAGDRLAAGLAGADADVVVDVGRLGPRSPAMPLARRAVVTLLVSRPRFEDVAALAARVPELRAAGCAPALVVVGQHPYAPDEVAGAAGAALAADLPDDPRAAAVLAGGPGGGRRLRRSLLWRALAELASRLATHAVPFDIANGAVPEPPAPAAGPEQMDGTVAEARS